jgi:hypothetical protein
MEAIDEERDEESKRWSPLCLPYQLVAMIERRYSWLTYVEDTTFVLAGLEFVDMVGDDLFAANDITRHVVAVPAMGRFICT